MLNRHLRLHSGIRPYCCPMCNTYFSRSDHLSTHLRTHTGEKPYTCPQCSYTACRRDMITRHSKIHMKKRSSRKNATSTFASSNDL
jgi:KRAB domain-containing zinc finger protein